MDEIFAVILPITLILGPVIGISFLMTSKNKKLKVRGYYFLSGLITFFGFGCFYMAYTGENTAGYAWMGICALGTMWAYKKADKIKNEKE